MARYTVNGYTSRNPDFTFDVTMPANFSQEQAAQAVADEIHECDWQRDMAEAAKGYLTLEEDETLADDSTPGQRVFVIYALPSCAYDVEPECEGEPGSCDCEGDVYMLTFDPIAE